MKGARAGGRGRASCGRGRRRPGEGNAPGRSGPCRVREEAGADLRRARRGRWAAAASAAVVLLPEKLISLFSRRQVQGPGAGPKSALTPLFLLLRQSTLPACSCPPVQIAPNPWLEYGRGGIQPFRRQGRRGENHAFFRLCRTQRDARQEDAPGAAHFQRPGPFPEGPV